LIISPSWTLILIISEWWLTWDRKPTKCAFQFARWRTEATPSP
jgi:hypothetical protein